MGRKAGTISLARREMYCLLRTPALWLLPVGLVGMSALYFSPNPQIEKELGSGMAIAALQMPVIFCVAISGLVVGYRSIVSEVESGSILLTAAMPLSRREIIFGKVIGRTIALLPPIFLGVVSVWLLSWPQFGLLSASLLFIFIIITFLYTLLHVCVGLLCSTVFRSSVQAAAGAFGYLVTFVFFWGHTLIPSLYVRLTGSTIGFNPPAHIWLFFARRLSPRESFILLTNQLIDVGNTDERAIFAVAVSREDTGGRAFIADQTFEIIPPILSPWMAILILISWLTIGLATSIITVELGELRR